MQEKASPSIKTSDFEFENSLIKVIANRNCPEIKLVGLNVGPFEEGNVYEIQFWVAQELEKVGIVRFREEELLDAKKIYKIQWMERVQTPSQISKLPEEFYPKLRRYLAELKKASAKSPEKMREYEKSMQVIRDMINARLKKIVSLATANFGQTEQVLKNLTSEERLIYERLRKLIHNWKAQILEHEEEQGE
ncbi:MAG: hypothetical protein QXV21_04425 [Candidatus Bathyarchaeia archaeon]